MKRKEKRSRQSLENKKLRAYVKAPFAWRSAEGAFWRNNYGVKKIKQKTSDNPTILLTSTKWREPRQLLRYWLLAKYQKAVRRRSSAGLIIPRLPFLDYLYLQIIKIYMFYKIILTESCFGVTLEIVDRGFKPYGDRQIEFIAGVLKGCKDLLRARAFVLIGDNGIAKHMIILENLAPHSEHIFFTSLCGLRRR